jgi:radical SAM superfamily enzyme YgiQ (UPF0313 family)
MKITLVYPGIAQIGFASYGRGTPNTNLMSLGLGYLSSSIKQNSDHAVDLIDLRKLRNWDHFKDELAARSSDIVGIHTNTVNFEYAMKCAEIAHNQKRIVIAGGPHATYAPQALMDTGNIDHVVVGEGEFAIVDLLDRLKKGRTAEPVIQGQPVENLDVLPFPDRDLFDLDRRLKLPGVFPFPTRYVGILASRGCGSNCAFCQPLERKLFGKRIKFRSVDNIMKEVHILRDRYQANFIMFQDDQLTQKRAWLLELCGEMKKTHVLWGALARVDRIDAETLRSMREAGCVALHFGFESGSQRILDFLRKKTTVEQALTAAKLCREHGILIFANYMLGIPTESDEDLRATLKLIGEIKPEIHGISYFSPIPGSDLYEYCRDNDLIKVSSYEMYVRSVVDNKIKGIDYKLVGKYRRRIEKHSPPWYSENHYSSLVRARWRELFANGHRREAFKEIVFHTPVLNAMIGGPYRMLGLGDKGAHP